MFIHMAQIDKSMCWRCRSFKLMSASLSVAKYVLYISLILFSFKGKIKYKIVCFHKKDCYSFRVKIKGEWWLIGCSGGLENSGSLGGCGGS